MPSKNGKAHGSKSHISHRLPRVQGRFARLEAPMVQPAPAGGKLAVPFTGTFAARVQTVSGKRVLLNPDEAVRQSRLNANKMRLDLAVKKPFEERMLPTILAPWRIEPEDANNSEQVEIAEGLTRIVDEIPKFTSYRSWLLEGVFFGRSAVNNVFNWCFGDDHEP